MRNIQRLFAISRCTQTDARARAGWENETNGTGVGGQTLVHGRLLHRRHGHLLLGLTLSEQRRCCCQQVLQTVEI